MKNVEGVAWTKGLVLIRRRDIEQTAVQIALIFPTLK
jgi:hypothetical protein